VLQDPNNLDKFNIEKFHHVQYDLKTKTEIEDEKKAMESPLYYLNRINNEAKEALSQLEKQYVPKKTQRKAAETADSVSAAHYSQGKVSSSLTSTAMAPETLNEAAVLDESAVKYARVTKNGYVQLVTNYGPLNLELYCKHAPMACENFIVHCREGYYNNTRFHRLIKNFIVQGGDPTGTGKGGESIWGKAFEDEIHGTYRHDGRGVLSMANAGTNTNKSQFFITFRSCKHLDGKHTIFGKLVGGGDTLRDIEKVETDSKTDAPLDPIVVLSAKVFIDPFEDAAVQVEKERKDQRKKETPREEPLAITAKPKAYSSGVGKYIKPDVRTALKRKLDGGDGDEETAAAGERKVPRRERAFGDFSKW